MRILLVEDDELLTETLTVALSQQNYVVDTVRDGQSGWELVEAYAYDLVVTDVMLPKLDGFSLCRQIRNHGYQMPILLLTALDSGTDKTTGLDAGADDYVVKPFDLAELIARVRALLRRGSATSSPILAWNELHLDPTTCEVTYRDQLLSLTPKEYALLELFLRNGRRVFSCGAILEHLWSFEDTPGEEAVRTHIKGLRQKLKAAGAPSDLVETVYGIGYRLKPIEKSDPPEDKKPHRGKKESGRRSANLPVDSNGAAPSTASTASPTPATPEVVKHQQTLAAVNRVFDRFKQQFTNKIALLEQAALALEQHSLSPELHESARQEAHTLAGSLGTFGYGEGSRLARQIETLLKASPLPDQEGSQLQMLVASLRQQLDHPPQSVSPITQALPTDDRPLLLVIDQEVALRQALAAEVPHWGLRFDVATSLTAAQARIDREAPAVVLLDLNLAPNHGETLAFVAELTQRTPPIPVLVCTTEDGFGDRVQVARAGGRAFLHKPITPAQVLQHVTQVLQQQRSTARVMAVDDDRATLMALRSLLQPWGLQLTTLDNPLQFWETLEAATPDLLMLDIEMPGVSGLELCQVVRNDPYWSGLPVLFLTAHNDPATVQQVFAVGADDYVTKPILGQELVTRIINRLERIQLLRTMAETDPLTRVANRHKSTQALNEFLHLADRHHQPLCFAVLDLDHFKAINHEYGHATGDEALRQLGQLLLQAFRGEDVVARWAGEEFIVGMYGLTRQEGVERLTEVLTRLHQQPCTPAIRFSAGVAEYPTDGRDLQALYLAADQALSAAKAAGRDRVVPYTAVPTIASVPSS